MRNFTKTQAASQLEGAEDVLQEFSQFRSNLMKTKSLVVFLFSEPTLDVLMLLDRAISGKKGIRNRSKINLGCIGNYFNR
jgi:hypothetical protein